MPELLDNKYVYWLITGAIALLGSAVIFFLKRELNKLDSRQKEQDNRINDVEDKLIAAPPGEKYTAEEMAAAIHFQEQYYDTYIEAFEGE